MKVPFVILVLPKILKWIGKETKTSLVGKQIKKKTVIGIKFVVHNKTRSSFKYTGGMHNS